MNSQRIVRLGIGRNLDINTLTTSTLELTLQELLTNASYRRNMRKLSELAKDQPMTSVESAVWWTEYVIRHKGAKHLHAKDRDLPIYQYLMLDIVLAVVVVVCIVVLLVKKGLELLRAGFAKLSRKFWSEKRKTKKKKK
jgi:glucuronosyltransferase